jgi:hypothetical protein
MSRAMFPQRPSFREAAFVNPLLLLAQAAPEVEVDRLLAGGLCLFVFAGLVSLASFVVWLWALIDAIKNPALDSNERLIWVVVIVFTSLLGAVIYFILGRNRSI